LTARRTTITSTSLLRDAAAAELRTAGNAVRQAVKKPSHLATGIAATAVIGVISASAATAPWASAATSKPASPLAQAAREAAVKPAQLAPAGLAGQSTTTASPTGTGSGQATAASATASHSASAQAASAKPATAKHAAAPSKKPSTIYDSVTPSTIPSGKDAAVYADGTYQASTASVAGHKHVLWIDTNGSRTDANVLDVEPGDATPAGAAAWVKAKLTKDPNATAIVYTFKSDWASVISSIQALPKSMQAHVKYWIADPTGTPHILPGAEATQWYWGANYDISAAKAGFNS
jgi:hypothetical protein